MRPANATDRVWPDETAGRLASESFPRAFTDETVGSVLARIFSQPVDCLDLVVVEDERRMFCGAAALADVVRADAEASLATVMDANWPRVAPGDDQEHAGQAATASGVSALPVVGADGRVVGCIPAATILRVMAREHQEDLHRLAGILRENSEATQALDGPPLRQLARRLPWLVVGLALSAFAALIMAGFQDALQANVAIAFFIPSLVYLADAIGTQTETIAVRGLSHRHRPLTKLLKKEILTGAMIGLILGVAALAAVWVGFGDIRLATGVAISLFVAGTVASAIGLLLPWLLSHLGIDPAFGSGPVATIIQDVLTIGVYFLTMSVLIS